MVSSPPLFSAGFKNPLRPLPALGFPQLCASFEKQGRCQGSSPLCSWSLLGTCSPKLHPVDGWLLNIGTGLPTASRGQFKFLVQTLGLSHSGNVSTFTSDRSSDSRLNLLLRSPAGPPGQTALLPPLCSCAPAFLPSGKPTLTHLNLPEPSTAHRPTSSRKPSGPPDLCWAALTPGPLLDQGAFPELPQRPIQHARFTGKETEAQRRPRGKASWTKEVLEVTQASVLRDCTCPLGHEK